MRICNKMKENEALSLSLTTISQALLTAFIFPKFIVCFLFQEKILNSGKKVLDEFKVLNKAI